MTKSNLSQKAHLALGVLAVFVIVIFALQNAEVVTVNILFWKLEMSRVILILVTLIIGFLLGYIFHGLRRK